MAKKLTPELFASLKAGSTSGVVSKFTPTELARMTTEAEAMYAFQPPLTFQAWLAATDVAGRLYGTKSRGDRLQAVDRAYKAWIEFAGAEEIAHAGNAENLRNTLETYIGVIYRMTGPVSGLSRDFRDARNKDNVITNTLKLTSLLSTLCAKAAESTEAKRRQDRRAMLSLIANIKVEWNPVGTIIGGLAGAAGGTNELISKGMAKDIVMACEAGAAVVGAGVGVAVVDDIPGKIKTFLKEQWAKFKKWLSDTFTRHFGLEHAADLLEKASKALAVIMKYAMEAVASYASGAADIYEGLKGLISDAWTRRTLTLQQAQLVTSDGAFALIRNGIDVGIRNRQVVSTWKIVKGTITTVVAATSAAAAGKIADLVLGAFEFLFKLLYNLIEVDSIKTFIGEAKTMWNNVKNAPTPQTPVAAPVAAGPRAPTVQNAFVVPHVSTGTMPKFKAAHYTPEQFLADQRGAYLNFLDSLVKSSPVMAAVVMNSGAFSSIEDVMHSATPRSTDDVERAAHHIKSLKIEAERLFLDSTFEVIPDTGTMGQEDHAIYTWLLNNAKLAKQPATASA